MEFDWDNENREHLARHGVTPQEAEQVIFNSPFEIEYQIVDGEERVTEVGETALGRILVVVTIERENKVRVVTAFAPSKRIRLQYLQERRKQDAR